MQDAVNRLLGRVSAERDTIVAISTPFGRSAIGVVRISGPDAQRIANGALPGAALCRLADRVAVRCRFRESSGEALDDVVMTLFRGPRSYTGEDVVEIGAHGNPFVLDRIVKAVQQSGARQAGPGEFTWRAVANGKLDLLQAEAVRDFIDAQTENQARTALRQMEGALSKRIAPVKDSLIDIIAQLEASIDFVEDELEVPETAASGRAIEGLAADLAALAGTFGYGRMLTSGLRLVIAGKPNVGKSSLFNRLLAADRAIVTEIPGTTRDVLNETASIGGIPIQFSDTAGIREAVDFVEGLGVGRSMDALADADIVLVVLDGSRPLDDDDERVLSLVQGIPHVVVANKCDLEPVRGGCARSTIEVSAKTGAGFRELEAALEDRLVKRPSGGSEGILTNARQHEAVESAMAALRAAAEALSNGTPQEMALLDLYTGLGELNALTGEVLTEDILGRVFSRFCVGK